MKVKEPSRKLNKGTTNGINAKTKRREPRLKHRNDKRNRVNGGMK